MVALLFCMRTMNPIFRITNFRITNNTRKGGNTMLLTIIKISDMIFSVSGIVYLLTVAIERKDGIVEDEIISRISSISAVYSLMFGVLTVICCLVYLILY